MGQEKSHLQETLAALRRERDELALKIHLGKAEARDELKQLGARLDALENRARPAKQVVQETAGEVGASLELAADEIKKGFARLRKLI